MSGLKRKLKGSTLMEVLVAMIIILTCVGITMMIFSNLSAGVNDELRILAEIRMNTIATETKLKNDLTEATFEFENIHIQRSILPFPQKARMKILYLEAQTLSGKKIAEYKEIITLNGK
jgi:hypothetical protein